MKLRCPLCGVALEAKPSRCQRCVFGARCDMLCCPRCGYRTVAPRSVTVDFVKRVLRRE